MGAALAAHVKSSREALVVMEAAGPELESPGRVRAVDVACDSAARHQTVWKGSKQGKGTLQLPSSLAAQAIQRNVLYHAKSKK